MYGKPSGKHSNVGSSWRGSPFNSRFHSPSPPGRKASLGGVKTYLLMSGMSGYLAPSVCLNPPPAQTPDRSGLPSAVRGMAGLGGGGLSAGRVETSGSTASSTA